jgi:hypothetical protein
MNSSVRQTILRGNAPFLGLFGAVSFFMLDVRGIWFSSGPQTAVLRGEPASGVGFLEAHGLAVVVAVWLWRSSRTENPDRAWHLTAAAVHTLLATLHCLFAMLQLVAARYASQAELTRH